MADADAHRAVGAGVETRARASKFGIWVRPISIVLAPSPMMIAFFGIQAAMSRNAR